ncbi:electron transport complex subunit RsxC [Rheinheimera salexigens]|uniref:Ion-translocating oxidoreductase complex subunit C n=1 Tax=Rheinheimera salexigens TaxID=1628148 RepID=A0A1E7Q5Q3_9GAMM|nr:electron transport complex subunit RsxC [Rheinheimera salexigens]OEY69509.1 electron transport complex subunit RsxC [Rheinheimera salexigens]
MQSLFEQIQSGKLWDFHGGIHPPSRKNQTNNKPIARLPMPDRLYLPLRQHIGIAGQLLVNVGDRVLKGQALTAADNAMTVPIHAPTSGHVISIGPHSSAHPSALPEITLTLAPDGLDEWRLRQPLNFTTCDNLTLLNRIHDNGIAGMGGAGFPTHLKVGSSKTIDYLIINAVECEPYITADDLLMQEAATTIVKGIDILFRLLQPKAVLIAIEDDKPIATAAMSAASNQRDNYWVRNVPTKYPSGGEKQLIELLTGTEVPTGRRPLDIGIVMQNVGTVFAIAQAVLDDHPLISRIVTVAGDTLDQPQNVLALLGTPVADLLDFCGFSSQPKQRAIMGGPMMGFTLPRLDIPVIKTTNCILAPTATELPAAEHEMDCIRCSACADACPASLLPQQLLWYSKAQDVEKLQQYNLFDCIECGACAYVCPSEIPLVQYYRVAKAELREQQQEAIKAEQAKARFDARNERLEREKLERQQRNEQLAAARAQQQQASGKASAVADALAKIKAKTASRQTEPTTLDRDAIIAQRELKKQQARDYQQAKQANTASTVQSGADNSPPNPADAATEKDPRKAAIAAAIARAKAKQTSEKLAQPDLTADTEANVEAANVETETKPIPAVDPRKAAIAAAIARAKAKQASEKVALPDAATDTDANVDTEAEPTPAVDPRKAAIAAAIARAKAKQASEKLAQPDATADIDVNVVTEAEPAPAVDPRKAAIAAAIARAKAKKQADKQS